MNIKEYIASGILEAYLLGGLTAAEAGEVEAYVKQYPEIRAELKKLYDDADGDFETFLSKNFFDLHYQAKPNARSISLGLGNLWKLAVDHPESQVPPCLHRAPKEKSGQKRLLLIC